MIDRASAAAVLLIASLPATAQIIPRGSVPTSTGTVTKAKGSPGPITNALPGCGEGGEVEYDFDAPPPPERRKLGPSPGAVDMRAGQLMFQNEDVSIGGEGDAGLSLVRSFSYRNDASPFRQAMGQFFTHNWDIQVQERRTQRAGACYPSQFDYAETIVFGDLGDAFRKRYNQTYFDRTSSAGYAELTGTFAGSGTVDNLVFTARDGTVVTFGGFLTTCAGPFNRCAYATTVRRPDGTLFTLEYDTPPSGYGQRLRSVTSNRGYALVFEAGGESASFQLPAKVCALNLAVTLKPANNTCPAGARTAAYTYSGAVQTSATEMGGGVWAFTQPTASSFALTRPGDAQPYVANSYSFVRGTLDDEPALVIDSQQMADGRTYAYTWSVLFNDAGNGNNSQHVAGGMWADGVGRSFTAAFGAYHDQPPANGSVGPTYKSTPGPETITDELGRVTRFDYCSAVAAPGGNCIIPPVRSVTDPEGNKETYAYVAFNNIGEVRRVAKPSSGLPDLVETRTFDANAPVALRAKPTAVTDARGSVTSYTYDQTHGGVLTETSPAGANGVQAVRRFAYVQRSAWLSTGGGFGASGAPVWVLAEERSCRTSATVGNGCAGGAADEVVTTYDYGPDNGSAGNNLLVRGVTATADGQVRRTCYGYDADGNRIWEAKPRAARASCW